MSTLPDLAIVLSFYNEEDVLQELIDRIRKTMQECMQNRLISSYELIFINDSSTDSSIDILRSNQAFNDLTIINLSRNYGVSSSVMAGFQYSSA